jgi:adenylate kinase family enzyme
MSDLTLSAALDALATVARSAGVDPDVARREGESLSATIAEPAKGAYVDWSEQTGGDRSAEDFMDAASRGRRYRAAPTPTMAGLSLARSTHAPAYAKALSDVALAACTLGEANPRVIGNATTASAAQLGETPNPLTRPHPVPEEARDEPSRRADGSTEMREPVPGVGDNFLAQMLDQLGQVQRKLTNLDLTEIDRGVPGAFDLTGETGGFEARRLAPQPPTAPEPPVVEVRGAPATSLETTPKEPEPEPKTVDELLAELDELVGLKDVKAEIHRQAAVLRVEGLRKDAGLAAPTITRHLIFNGNPGTGKTTVARLVAGIYRALGLLSTGQLVEVDRSELVAGYLGQTAMKTADVVKSAEGGVLFIDEAYSLAGDQYGQEAVDTLVKEMEDKRDNLVVIVAGYPLPMEVFIAQNPGLESRFRTTIDFVDYTDDELAAIFAVMAEAAEYDVDEPVLERLRQLLATVTRGPTFGNARYVRNMLEAAIGRHAWRLREVDQPTLEQLRTLEPDDLDSVALEPPTPAPAPEPAVDFGTSEPPVVEPLTPKGDDAPATEAIDASEETP